MTRSIVRNKRALSPVIATVILVSVTIVVAVSVAYWMGTIAGGYTAFEQIELPTAYATSITTTSTPPAPFNGWNITIELKNTGSADATIIGIFLNAKPLKDYTSGDIYLYSAVPPGGTQVPETLSAISVSITKGSSATFVIQVKKYDEQTQLGVQGCTPGTRIDLKIHSAAGRDYPVQVKLP